jgi:multidrug resistance efflux pump
MFREIENNYRFLNRKTGINGQAIYLIIMMMVLAGLASLPFIYIDISVKSPGITRPLNERTEIKSLVSGIIDTVFYEEGTFVQKGALILKMKNRNISGRKIHASFEISQYNQYIHDLILLTGSPPGEDMVAQLRSSLYAEQLHHFLKQKTELGTLLKKADKEVAMNTGLAKDKVISPKEFFDIQNNQEKLQAEMNVLIKAQVSGWQNDLAKYRLELSRFLMQAQDIEIEANEYLIWAPVSGIIQGIAGRYQGGALQATEQICSISPEDSIIGECWIQAKDRGLLITGQTARFQINAFDYNYFGTLTGRIASIDNDYTVIDNKPAFKVRCRFDSIQLHSKNGFTGQVIKGLDFQARFSVARRSLWQSLFDKLDDWFNPNAIVKE